MLDTEGNKTEQYGKLKKINAEIKNIANVYMKYRSVDTHLIGFENEPWLCDFPLIKTIKSLDTGVIRDLHAGGGKLVVGQMINKTDPYKSAYVICNATDAYDEASAVSKVTFRSGKTVKLYSGEGIIPLTKKGNEYTFELGNCHGVIITVE